MPDVVKRRYALDLTKVWERFRGIVTYGSPLETFARTWPAIVQLSTQIPLPKNCEWVNLYDPIDIVASKLSSFGSSEQSIAGSLPPQNFACHSSLLIGKSHIGYWNITSAREKDRAVAALIEWMLNPQHQFGEFGLTGMTEAHHGIRRSIASFQWIVALILGGLLWPFAAFNLLLALQFALGGILRALGYFVQKFTVFSADLLQGWAEDLFERARKMLQLLSPTRHFMTDITNVVLIYGTLAAVLVVTGASHYLLDVIRDERDRKRQPLLSERPVIKIRGKQNSDD